MPRENIDYSNTIIYKIQCKNPLITDIYVGHTTNFSQRKYAHKLSCKKFPHIKPYKFITENGGWDNWDMIEIAKYNCKDATEARIKEQEHYEILNSTLNSCAPYVDKIIFYCKICDKQYDTPKEFQNHLKSKLHNCIKEAIKNNNSKSENTVSMEDTDVLSEKSQKNESNKYECIYCDYITSNLKDFNKHKNTPKHAKLTCSKGFTDNLSHLSQNEYRCNCGNIYKHRQSLFNHKKKCNGIQNTILDDNNEPNKIHDLVITIMKEFMNGKKEIMKEQQNMMVEVIKNGLHNTTTNNINNNSHNKTFNLQFFLNETCKNAMNLTDFIDSIKLQLADLIKMGEVGYVEGISSIITSNLQALDVTERPIHCTDKKRETVYIKDEDKWEKDDDNKNKLRKVIKNVAYKNEKLLPQFKQKYPGYNNSESQYSDQYSKIVIEAMGGIGKNDKEKEDKIIRNISKVITIDKEELAK